MNSLLKLKSLNKYKFENKKPKALYGLPPLVKFCKKCTISNQRPNSAVEMKNKNKHKATIAFNEEGICSACSFNSEKKNIDWKEREDQLFKLLEPFEVMMEVMMFWCLVVEAKIVLLLHTY